ncbi:hypothetical protein QQG55_17675 [Brugia pahangi]|uniref:Uncharacterized protein n=1 Tax=Brugia pahangi TaxID=6280 RepID=A0A0N4TBT4_BRUPA|nr:unnamed protein product [Brugia pahangi]
MTDERIAKQMESGGNVSGNERRAEIANIENEVAAFIQQGWLLIREYNVKMLKYLRLKMTCNILHIKRSRKGMQ